MTGFILLALGVCLFGYLSHVHIQQRRSKNLNYKTEVTEFLNAMGKLGVEPKEAIEELIKYKSVEELKKANKRLKKAIKKYQL
jgi:hypothetical protein